MRLAAVLVLAAFALAGCNTNEAPHAAASADAYNPIKYAQTSGFYAGR
jgi:hypothetical protein